MSFLPPNLSSIQCRFATAPEQCMMFETGTSDKVFQDYLCKWNSEVKEKPDVDHLDVGSFWQGVGDADEPEVEEVRSEIVHLYFSGII